MKNYILGEVDCVEFPFACIANKCGVYQFNTNVVFPSSLKKK